MDEIWKPIPGWEGDYEVSNLGRVRSLDRYITAKDGKRVFHKGKIRWLGTDQHGYYQVQLSRGDKRKLLKVHRAVCMAFYENPSNKPCVNHKDNNPRNNVVDNLEWCTRSENTQWMLKQGRANRTAEWVGKLTASLEKYKKPVVATHIVTGETIYFDGVNDTAKYGFQPSCVSNCCHGKKPMHKNYRWAFSKVMS